MIGLTDNEVIENREKYGSNDIINNNKNSFIKLFIESLGDPIIRILLIALGIKTVFLIKNFDWYETVGIVIAIFIASFVSSISEYGSEKAFTKLQEEASKINCKVLRNNKKTIIPIIDVVVNDLVILEQGDKIPADGIIISGNVAVDEAAITGESKEKEKNKNDQVLKGSVVVSKEAIMRVEKVGKDTIYGAIADELKEKSPDSPLKSRLRELAKIISRIGYIGAFCVALAYLFSNIIIANNFDMAKIIETIRNFPLMTKYILHALTLCVTVIVVAVPEGLPMMITLVLSSNTKKMLKNNVLVRKLVGIETAGNINILFSDKTGTLTKGKLEVIEVVDGDLNKYNMESEIKGKIYEYIKDSMVYNNSSYRDLDKVVGGNSTDRALLEFIKTDINSIKKIKTIPFDSKNKYMMTVIEKNKKINLIKGAPEIILNKCLKYINKNGDIRSFYNKKEIEKYISKVTKKGIRVIALALGETDKIDSLNFVGIVLIKDEIRKEAKQGIELVKKANIQTVMITGDNKDTACAIAKELGLLEEEKEVITSSELNSMSDIEIKKIIPKLAVVSRALPKDKTRLVRISQEMGLIVGMTGDGVNDSPALKKADVGFSMGSGTEVSKEASDIVIMDDNFLSIVKAVLFGRTIFKSIRKFIVFQLTVNFCAISLSIIGPFIGINAPITVIQMLWINMVMDTFAGLAFSYEPVLLEYMEEKPKEKKEPIINKYMFSQIITTGLYSTLLCILFLKLPFFKALFRTGIDDEYFMTAFFGLFIFISIFNAFNARTTRINLLANIVNNKMFIAIIGIVVLVQIFLIYYGGELFRTAGLTFFELQIIIFLSFTVIPIDWIRKKYLKIGLYN